jgi:hypothetical protein
VSSPRRTPAAGGTRRTPAARGAARPAASGPAVYLGGRAAPPARPLLHIRARGHPSIRAVHHKTLEITAGAAITGRATCVIGVAAEVASGDPRAVAGPVRVRVEAAGHSAAFLAMGNPFFAGGPGLVVRRSRDRLPGTLATEAGAAAADLPAALRAALRDPGTRVDVIVEAAPARADGRPQLVLAWSPAAAGPSSRLRAELAAAQAVIAEDAATARMLAACGLARGDPADVEAACGSGGRVVTLGSEVLPGPAAVPVLARDDAVLETAGLPPVLAAAAACRSPAPILLWEQETAGDAARGLLALAGACRTVLRGTPASLRRTLRLLGASAAPARGAVLFDPQGPRETLERGGVASLLRGASPQAPVVCALEPEAPAAGGSGQVPRQLIQGLLDEGVSVHTIARALTGWSGLSRRAAFAAAQDLKDGISR